MAKKRFYSGDYAGSGMRREQEARDFSMISENKSAVANMPQEVVYKAWPKAGHYASYDLDDTIRGIDEQMNGDGAGMKRHKSRSKY